MSVPTINALAKLMLMPLDKAERRFKKMGEYDLPPSWEGRGVFTACFYQLGIEAGIGKAGDFRFPDEEGDIQKVIAFTLKSPQYCREISKEFSPYTGKLFRNVPFSASREDVRAKLGPPEYSYDPARYDEYPLNEDCSFQFVYKRGWGEVSYCAIVTSRDVRRRLGIIEE